MKSISRRQFIKGGVALAMTFLMGTKLRLYGIGEESLHIIEGTRNILGTSVTVSIIHHDVDVAKEAMALAFNEVFKINDLMSVYRANSEVYILNENGFYDGASADTIRVIARADHYSRLSGGAFAITVLPIMTDIRFTRSMLKSRRRRWSKTIFSRKHFAEVFSNYNSTRSPIWCMLELTNYENLLIGNGNIEFKKAGMGITLGGIAKGYAVDRAIEVLRQNGIERALINAGGDIRTIGGKTEEVPWRIALRNPENREECITVIELCDKAIATSGNYERYFSEDAKMPHIVNARTGCAAQEMMSATVIAENAMDADALSTTIFLLGVEKGMELVERLSGVEALMITNDRRILRSSGFQFPKS